MQLEVQEICLTKDITVRKKVMNIFHLMAQSSFKRNLDIVEFYNTSNPVGDNYTYFLSN